MYLSRIILSPLLGHLLDNPHRPYPFHVICSIWGPRLGWAVSVFEYPFCICCDYPMLISLSYPHPIHILTLSNAIYWYYPFPICWDLAEVLLNTICSVSNSYPIYMGHFDDIHELIPGNALFSFPAFLRLCSHGRRGILTTPTLVLPRKA